MSESNSFPETRLSPLDQYIRSAQEWDARYPFEAGEEAFNDLVWRMLIGMSSQADDDGKYETPLSGMPLINELLSGTGHERIDALTSAYPFQGMDDGDELSEEFEWVVRDALSALDVLFQHEFLEWVSVRGVLYLRITNLESVLDLSVKRHPRRQHFAAKQAVQAQRIRDLRAMTYDEYLASPEWRFRRERHIEFAGGRCQLCNDNPKTVHVHHRTYERRGFERAADLIVLCPGCHELFHTHGRLAK